MSRTAVPPATQGSWATSESFNFLKNFVAGGIAGCFAKTTVAPFDRVKILLQAHNQHYKNLAVFSSLAKVVRVEGFRGLFRGNGAQMVRIYPYAALQFSSYEYCRKVLARYFDEKWHFTKMIAGSFGGFVAVTCTYPLDVIRARLAFQVQGEEIYDGIRHTITRIIAHEGGFRALYRGYLPTVLGMMPYAGVSFYTFERLKSFLLATFPSLSSSKDPTAPALGIPLKLFCGAIAGATAQTASYPLDVVRRRIQLSGMMPDPGKYHRGMLSIFLLILREDGIRKGLYRGLSINYLRAVPMVSVSFCTYELLKQWWAISTLGDKTISTGG